MTDPQQAQIESLFEVIREACSPAIWSRGVSHVRAGAVNAEAPSAGGDDERCFRVSTRGGMLSLQVALLLEDEEWECECDGRDDPCEHVAAAAIALRRSDREGEAPPAPERGRIAYRLSRSADTLAMERDVVSDAGEARLESTLDAVASGRAEGPAFAATRADVNVERALGPRLRGALQRGRVAQILDALSRCDDVQLDGVPVATSGEPLRPRALLEDVAGGFRLRPYDEPGAERFDCDAVLLNGVLRPIGASRLSGRERADLREGRVYPFDRATELVSEVLPDLQRRIEVLVQSQRLPKAGPSEAPRPRVEVRQEGEQLVAMATIVYGEPPRARVDAGRLVHLEGAIPVRDEAAERRVAMQLRSELGLKPGHRVALAGEEALALAERLGRFRNGVRGDAHRSFRRTAPLVPELRIEGERFSLEFSSPGAESEAASSGGQRRADVGAVFRAWHAGESLVPLQGGGLAPIPSDWLAEHGRRVADLLAARQADGRLARAALPDLARLCEALDEPPPPALAALAKLTALDQPAEARLPDDLRAELRSYQQEGVAWLVRLRSAGLGALLADDMGLGKTVQALCALRGRSLVVAPTSLLHNWSDEIARFRPGLRVALYHGPGRSLDADAEVTLTSYALLRLDASTLAEVGWDCVVLDEAQAIKNPDSQVARAAFSLCADFRIGLTGTPIENRLEELWSQLHFLNRGLLGSQRDFQERYARPIADGESEAGVWLRERLRPFVLRRTKREVAPELPPRTEVVLHCRLSEDERTVYETVRAAARRDVVERLAAGGNVLAALEALLRLRQAACHPSLVPGQHAETSSKLELLLERCEQAVADGHKALIFSQWTAFLDLIEPHLRRRGLDFGRLDGSTRDRAGVVRRFQSDSESESDLGSGSNSRLERDSSAPPSQSGPPLLLVSLRAGGTGLNLTAADHVFLLDPWWNPAVEAQAADRAHRIGQTRPVFVHRLVAEDTVEEGILALQEHKRGLSEQALGEADGGAQLSREELLELLSA